MKRANPVLRTSFAEDHCALCHEVIEGVIISSKRRFRVTAEYTTGKLCESCTEKVGEFQEHIDMGGCLVMCSGCENLGVLPAEAAPENTDVLVMKCPDCASQPDIDLPGDAHP